MSCNVHIIRAAQILVESDIPYIQYGKAFHEVAVLLEDADSPVTRKYKEKLFQSVIEKGHIDFGDIPSSKGDIRKYKGYSSMVESLNVIVGLGTEEKSNAVRYAKIIQEAIKNIETLSTVYEQGFSSKTEYVMLEYNIYVYTCIQATTTLIYEFVDYIKRPDKPTYVIALKNSKVRADEFYFNQLRSFNNVQKNMQVNYRKMLESLMSDGKNNFTGAELIGIGTVSIVALAIVPITRELIYRFYNLRVDIAKELELQAQFLEMNKACVESNTAFTVEKRNAIIKKQESLQASMLKLANIIRVKEVKASQSSKRELDTDNRKLSVNNIRDEISSSPFEVL